ncbi:hypothetical protein INR49_027859 [Caranx melampygus]|nr:hypothetical protein INR49_027859 [Caranx melampygus]
MEMTDDMVTCSSHNIYPVPQVTWATDPTCAQGATENFTVKTTDHKGLFTVESSLRILGNISNRTYFCSFMSADKTQVWTASRKNQEAMTQEEGHTLSIPCIAPNSLQNFSLTWTFTSASEPTVVLRYDSRTRHTFNLWEGQAELDQDLLLRGDGSLLLHRPDSEEHSGYTPAPSLACRAGTSFKPTSYGKLNADRQEFRVIKCNAMESRAASHRCNGAGINEGAPHKASYIIMLHGAECNRLQLQFEAQGEEAGSSAETAENVPVTSQQDTKTEEEQQQPEEGAVEGDGDELQSSGLEMDGFGCTDPGLHIPCSSDNSLIFQWNQFREQSTQDQS